MSDLTDVIFGGGITAFLSTTGYSEAACLKKANASSIVQALDTKTEDLARTWHPTGYYAPADIRSVVGQIISAGAQARAAVAVSPRSTSDAESMVKQAMTYLDRNETRSKTFIDAANKAAMGNGIVDAPGFKTWVTNSIINVSQAYTTAAMLSCAESWLQHGLAVVNSVIDAVKAVGGVLIQGGEFIVKAVGGIFGSKAFWYTTGAVGVLLLGLFAYVKVVRFKRAFNSEFLHPPRSLPPGGGV